MDNNNTPFSELQMASPDGLIPWDEEMEGKSCPVLLLK